MDDNHQNHRFISLHDGDFEVLLERAAERGARRALKDVGLEEPDAAEDLRELRRLLSALRLARTTAFQTGVRLATTALLLALMAGVAIKLKVFGGSP